MTTWPPLAAGLPTDRRRLANHLRRMLDRSGLTVPRLAARTALPEAVWRAALDATAVPPRAAVEVLAQASGADYSRVRALHRLAEKATGRPRPVPDPDPLDPLGPDDGLPRRRALLPAILGALAAAALAAVIVTAGPSTGRSPAADAGAPQTGFSATVPGDGPPRTPAAPAVPADPPHSGGSSAPAARAAGQPPASGDTPSAALAATAPVATSRTSAAGPPSYRSDPPPSAAGTQPDPSEPSSAPPASGPPDTHAPAPPASPGPTHSPVCIDLVLLGICIG